MARGSAVRLTRPPSRPVADEVAIGGERIRAEVSLNSFYAPTKRRVKKVAGSLQPRGRARSALRLNRSDLG
jgi:hypothetical protein